MADQISSKEQKMQDRVKQFVEEELNPISLQVEKEGRIPPEIVEKMRKFGFFGLSINDSIR